MKALRWAFLSGLAAMAIALIPFQAEGTDNQAQSAIEHLRPEYRPWLTPIFKPPATGEKALFALQAGCGAALLGWCISRQRMAK